jgi:hypothetical protein
MNFTIRQEPFSHDGDVFRAYYEDGRPLYFGSRTKEGCQNRVLEYYPDAKLVEDLNPGYVALISCRCCRHTFYAVSTFQAHVRSHCGGVDPV